MKLDIAYHFLSKIASTSSAFPQLSDRSGLAAQKPRQEYQARQFEFKSKTSVKAFKLQASIVTTKWRFSRWYIRTWIGSCVWIRKKKKNVESIVTIEEEEEYFEGEDELTTTKNILTAKAELCSQVTAFMGVSKDILSDLWYRLDRRSRQTNSAGFNLAEERYTCYDHVMLRLFSISVNNDELAAYYFRHYNGEHMPRPRCLNLSKANAAYLYQPHSLVTKWQDEQ
ncbi:hypothetical protein F5051DRAFT_501910 [Lentinula edodes]|nr:hypothetical protein F5051DRAFT_501910 [Lentinula edodes]KAJ3887452.1 hypothetical protein GG344DRAFT_68818 [Lentinula edodes]